MFNDLTLIKIQTVSFCGNSFWYLIHLHNFNKTGNKVGTFWPLFTVYITSCLFTVYITSCLQILTVTVQHKGLTLLDPPPESWDWVWVWDKNMSNIPLFPLQDHMECYRQKKSKALKSHHMKSNLPTTRWAKTEEWLIKQSRITRKLFPQPVWAVMVWLNPKENGNVRMLSCNQACWGCLTCFCVSCLWFVCSGKQWPFWSHPPRKLK